jgi:hypothetical protein
MGIYVDRTDHDHIKTILIDAGINPDDLYEMSGRTSQEIGDRWELDFAKIAKDKGYDVLAGKGKYDFIVNQKRVQCKAGDCISRPVVPIAETSNATRKTGCRYEIGDWDILAVRCPSGIYIVPEFYIRDRYQLGYMKTTFNPNKYQEYLDDWTYFEE